MRALITCLLISLFAATLPSTRACGQHAGKNVSDKQAIEFARLYEQWKKSKDREERITLGERALALEPKLTRWPVVVSRDRFKAELLLDLGSHYRNRQEGKRANNLERAIAHYEVALSLITRESDAKKWADLLWALGRSYEGRILGGSGRRIMEAQPR